MKNNSIFTIFKKELSRFFKDRRTMTAILMPGILIYIVYSLMGGAMGDAFMPDDDYTPSVCVENMPDSLDPLFAQSGLFSLSQAENDKISEYKEAIKNEGLDLLIVFPSDFDKKVSEYDISSGTAAPNIEIYYNSSAANSSMAYQQVVSLLDYHEAQMTNRFDINNSGTIFDLATEEDMTSMIFSMIMPMLLIMLLFSGCMAVAPESIAGEKERGTIASLLITPVKRSHIAIGKILALSVIALISGTSSTLGVVLSLPKLMGDTVTLDGSVYTLFDYAMLATVILSTVLVLISVISIISAFAKTVKEASSYVTPLMIASMLIGLSGMFGASATNPIFYAIPIYNSVQCMISIFSFDLNMVNILVTVAANVAVTGIGVFILTRMFNSEKIMFNK